jgi:hypothetical protein
LLPSENNREKEIAVFNAQPYQTEIEYIHSNQYEKTVKVAILGNSLSFHGIIDTLWDHESGMAASDIDHDYAHILLNKIAEKKQCGIAFIIINIADFERGFNNFDYTRLEKIRTFNPDILIFQLGENVSTEDMRQNGKLGKIFEEKYIELIQYCNVKNTIVCLPFWPVKEKIHIITEVALKSESYLVDLSSLGSGIEPLNLAKSEHKYKHAGVAAHPGNYGMNNIAQLLFITVNKIIE